MRIFFFLFFVFPVLTYAQESRCVSGNCINGYGVYNWINGDSYEGNWKESKLDGNGTYIWSNGSKYVGFFKDNTINGIGVFTSFTGDVYIGNYKIK